MLLKILFLKEECQHFVDESRSKLERAKTIGGKDGIYHENRTGMNCWIHHGHSTVSKAVGDRIADLIGFPLKNAESFQVVYYTGGTQYNDHHDAFNHETDEGKKHLKRGGQRIYTALGYLNDVEEGGATEFRDLNISVKPKKAVFSFGRMSCLVQQKFIPIHFMREGLLRKEKSLLSIYGLEKTSLSKSWMSLSFLMILMMSSAKL